jgi:hypothetical protein
MISTDDAAYSQLRLWIDANHNGYSEPEELITLGNAGVAAIYTGYHESRRQDSFGNKDKFAGVAMLLSTDPTRGKLRRVFVVYPAIR